VGLGEGRRWLKGDEGEEGQGVRGGTPGECSQQEVGKSN
jgi:hypothetical protein